MSPFGRTLSTWMAYASLVFLVSAVGYYLIMGELAGPGLVLLALGALAAFAGLVLEPDLIRRGAGSRQVRYGSNTFVLVLVAVAIVGVVNYLAANHSQRWDWTAGRSFSLSQQTVEVLRRIERPVSVTGFFVQGDPRRQEAEDLLKEYSSSSPNISAEMVDPDVEPSEARRLGIQQSGTIVFQSGDNRQDVLVASERDFTSALLKITSGEQKKVYFLTGHGERDMENPDSEGYGQVRSALEEDNFLVEGLSLMTDPKVPADAAVVILASPLKPLLPEEREALRAYLGGGGGVMVLSDPGQTANVEELLAPWQVQLGTGVAIDPKMALLGDAATPVVDTYGNSPIMQGLDVTVFPYAVPVTPPMETITGTVFTQLLLTSDASWSETDPSVAQFDDGQDTRGPLSLGVAVEVIAEDGAGRGTRLVIIGDSDFAADGAIQMASNRDFFVNSVNWLAESEEMITIRPKEMADRSMVLTQTQLNLAFISAVIVLPLAVIVAGGSVWWSRR